MNLKPGIAANKLISGLILLLCCFIGINASAQLQANFSVDKDAGCSPLSIKFSNTTTGASAAAIWQWNFGNGNTSALKDPGATYFTEKTYTVTLTVKDGSNSSTKSMTVTVYKKPTVDFAVTPSKGCAPLTVNFTSKVSAGDGTVANYLWDFGDGQNIQGNYNTATHIYNFPQVPPITLNVTNSFGCYAAITNNSLVEVVKGVQAAFTPSTATVCNVGESISFTNTSTGSGTLTYKWDFGDNTTSTEMSPSHTYATKGIYFATLTATSSDGCTSTLKSAALNVANFVADFEYPAKICLNQGLTFVNKSTKPFVTAEWWIDDSPYPYYTYNDADYYTVFYEPGQHTVKLVVYYGNCSVTTIKKITVNAVPQANGFIAELQGACGTPVTINYKDTTKDAVAWSWQNTYYGNTFASTQNAAYTYTIGGWDYVYLTVTNAAGCSSTTSKYVYYDKPNVSVSLTNTSNGGYGGGCTGLTLSFAATPDTIIKDFKWRYGDNTTPVTDSTFTHTFDKAGIYNITLDYTTKNGCKGTASYYNSIVVVDKPAFDFTSKQGTTICGNTPDTITATPAAGGWNYYWSFNNDYSVSYYGNSTVITQFNYDTTYTVSLFTENNGCRDTVIKKDYIKVLPPFPRIYQVFNTCQGTRGDVRFTEISAKALKWSWDFGDGGADNYTIFKDTIRHTYTKTGVYKVILSATNAGCTVKDSVNAYVLLKQKPLLETQQTTACGSDVVNFKLSGFEKNPYNYYYDSYYLNYKEYGDLTACGSPVILPLSYWQQETSGTIESLEPGKSDLRMMTVSYGFGCTDTSNFIPLKIHGPLAGFKAAAHSGCFKDPLIFTDTSRQFGNSSIVKWEWDFGDGTTKTLTGSGSTSYAYKMPGYYYVRLKVTDAAGCSNQSDYYLHYVAVGGPKADFQASAYTVPPNTTVYFSNASVFYDPYYSSSLEWIFSDSTRSTDPNPSFTYTNDGVYTVRLVTKNSETGCTDTATKTITVRKVNSAFTYQFSYINNNACPPVIATFKSVSTNAVRLSWDFGDGGIAGDQATVSHTYNNPGIYRVVHYSYDSNTGVDSTEDFIEVKGPYALLKADILTGCTSLQVKLTADVKYASDYTWDFGDGTVVPTSDTMAVHTYVTPGIYVPALILKDASGCNATSSLQDKVIVDSVFAAFSMSPDVICDSALSIFILQANSLSNDQLQVPLHYTWVIKEGNRADTLTGITASHYFHTIGAHAVSLEVTTPYGCVKKITDSVYVKAGVSATITGPAKICRGDAASFSGNATPPNNALQWKWDFGNGSFSDQQYPLPQQFNTVGRQQISLSVSNGFCADTAQYPVIVNALPFISFVPATPFVCKGSSINLTASGGISYEWFSGSSTQAGNAANINAAPAGDILYYVKVKDVEGCNNTDSLFVDVIEPTKLAGELSLFACQGNPVQLKVSGADKYKWINNTTGLSSVNISDPSALTASSAIYTVVGYDNYNCFSDTAAITVRISALPIVDAGISSQVVAGTAVTLSPNVSGAVNFTWSPVDYLNCTTCLNPVSKPKSSITYTLTAYNADGCKATDTVSLLLICGKNLVYIPTAFSPNNDNLNDRFIINGSGVRIIRSVTIYSRWGKLIFQRKNISISDRNNSWDGSYNGEQLPAGAYVYSVQTECEGGDVFEYRGTVMILR